MLRIGVEMVLQYAPGCRDPLRAGASLVRADRAFLAGARRPARRARGDPRPRAWSAAWSIDAVIADSLEQAKMFWRIREMFGEVQRHAGGSIKHDVSVPVAAVPAFIEEAGAAVDALIPGCRPMPFGHLGDGNIHYNVTQPSAPTRPHSSRAGTI